MKIINVFLVVVILSILVMSAGCSTVDKGMVKVADVVKDYYCPEMSEAVRDELGDDLNKRLEGEAKVSIKCFGDSDYDD